MAKVSKNSDLSIADMANDVLKNQNQLTVFATADGNVWIEKDKQFAHEHAVKTGQKLMTFNKK